LVGRGVEGGGTKHGRHAARHTPAGVNRTARIAQGSG
jgi:hypothetical protein